MTTATRSPGQTWRATLCGEPDRKGRRLLDRLGRDRIYEEGAVIVDRGARADRFAVIIDGRVEVEAGGVIVATLETDDFFGEVAMLYTQPPSNHGAPSVLPRTATVRAAVTTVVREFDHAELMTLMDNFPQAASRISRRAIGRLAMLNRAAAESPTTSESPA